MVPGSAHWAGVTRFAAIEDAEPVGLQPVLPVSEVDDDAIVGRGQFGCRRAWRTWWQTCGQAYRSTWIAYGAAVTAEHVPPRTCTKANRKSAFSLGL